MAGDTDFLALYHELGLRADCTPQALKLAYRKRVGELHPDRSPHDATTLDALQRVNVLYESAMAFHQRHGRLPGAPLPAAAGPSSVVSQPAHAGTSRVASSTVSSTTKPVPAFARRAWLALLAMLAIVVLWGWSGERDARRLATGTDGNHPVGSKPAPLASPASRLIELGSPAQQVRAIHGEPVGGSERRWEYGPSWIVLRCGVVVDWYSSPLRPLKVAHANPVTTDTWSPPKNCKD